MKRLSQAATRVEGQPMFRVLDQVQALERQGREIIHFELGEPDFDTPGHIIEAASTAMREGHTHYTSSMGVYEFRETIQETTAKTRGFNPDINQILVAPGANAIIYLAISALVEPGEEVIIPDPGFPTYFSVCSFVGAVPVSVQLKEENDFRLDPEDLRAKITPKTRLIILNSPSNPTGAVMTPEEIEMVAKIAEEHNIFILSDEIYVRLNYSESKQFKSPSYLDHCKERTIIINGFSKAFAMTGWRLGVALGPADVIEKMGLIVQTIVSCVAPFIQYAGIEAINGDQSAITEMKEEYQRRRDVLVTGLNAIDKISCVLPEGAIYAFPNVSQTGMSCEKFVDYVLNETGVAMLPGNNFGIYGESFARMCFVNNVENIERALEKIDQAMRKL